MKTGIKISCKKFSGLSLKFILIAFYFLPLTAISQQLMTVEQTVPIESGKKKKVFKDVQEWISSQSNLSVKQNSQEDVIVLDGFFSFENTVKYEASATYSRMYVSQTNGKLTFELSIILKEDQLVLKVGNFKHSPSARGEKIDFGFLTSSLTAPENLKMDYDEEWCDKVWISMKKLAEENSLSLIGQVPTKLMSSR